MRDGKIILNRQDNSAHLQLLGTPTNPSPSDGDIWLTGTALNIRIAGVTKNLSLPGDLAITGQAQGDVLYFDGLNWVRLPAGLAGQFLMTNGFALNPSWVNQSTIATDLSISGQAQGDVIYFNGTNWVRLAAGTAGQVLRTEGAGFNPTFGYPTSLTIASQAQGDVLYYNGSIWTRLPAGTAGQVLRTEGAGFDPTFGYPRNLTIASEAWRVILYRNATEWVRLPAGTNGQFLRTNGAGANPMWDSSPAIATDLNISGQTQGDIIYFNGTNWVRLPAGTNGQFLRTNGVGFNPSWDTSPSVATDLNISGQAQGDVLYYNGTNWVRLPAGTSGQFLKTNGAAVNPSWDTATTIASDLSIAGQAQGDVLYFNGTNWVRLAANTAGKVLRTEGAAANPTFGYPADLTIAGQVQGNIIYFNGTSWVRLATGTAGQVLRTEGAGANPTFGYPADLTISGQVQGDILYFNGTNWVRLAPGTSGQVLQTNGAAANPSWVTKTSVLAFTNATLSAGVLTHTHSLGQQYVNVQVYDNTDKLIHPDNITLTSTSVSTIDLSSFGTLTGTWHSIIQS